MKQRYSLDLRLQNQDKVAVQTVVQKKISSVCTKAIPPKPEPENVVAFYRQHLFTLNLFTSAQQALLLLTCKWTGRGGSEMRMFLTMYTMNSVRYID